MFYTTTWVTAGLLQGKGTEVISPHAVFLAPARSRVPQRTFQTVWTARMLLCEGVRRSRSPADGTDGAAGIATETAVLLTPRHMQRCMIKSAGLAKEAALGLQQELDKPVKIYQASHDKEAALRLKEAQDKLRDHYLSREIVNQHTSFQRQY
ncbi:hypothetical protein NDU88_002426 [Pleurodeles waltl]|uniref:Uncharacterized protein n=1 Tax=Pleurodeles waltl TaxID=8319 RepID=A0AAV7RBD8_PLEWA|nr:hypothetical protein NDU88_002426 [Pleurodeles waltl]